MLKIVREHLPEIKAAATTNITAKNSPKPYIEPVRYSLTRADFDIDILPNLCRFSFVPPPENLDWRGRTLANSYWLLSSSHYPDIRAAKDVCMGKCDDFSIMHVSRALRRNYETLRTAEIAGYKSVRVMSGGKHACEECKKIGGTELLITDLLAAYRNATIAFPHETPPYDDEDDTAHWCEDIGLNEIRKTISGADPKFTKWLNEHFEKNKYVPKQGK